MVVTEERDLLLASLKGYLEELKESGVDELQYASERPAVAAAEAPVEKSSDQAMRQQCETADAAVSEAPRPCLRQEGDANARLWLVMQGTGYAGEAGELLAKMIQAMKLSTKEVCLITFDAAAVPQREEILSRIAAAGPEVVVAFGAKAAQLLLQTAEPVETLRGKFHELAAVAVMPTLHPAQMLADQALKRQVWSELQQVMRRLEGYWDH